MGRTTATSAHMFGPGVQKNGQVEHSTRSGGAENGKFPLCNPLHENRIGGWGWVNSGHCEGVGWEAWEERGQQARHMPSVEVDAMLCFGNFLSALTRYGMGYLAFVFRLPAPRCLSHLTEFCLSRHRCSARTSDSARPTHCCRRVCGTWSHSSQLMIPSNWVFLPMPWRVRR
jgi:hypothetical protein